MKRPCRDDLEMAAEFLEHGDFGDVGSRVSTWLKSYAKSSWERSAARDAGCSVKYLRWAIEQDGKSA